MSIKKPGRLKIKLSTFTGCLVSHSSSSLSDMLIWHIAFSLGAAPPALAIGSHLLRVELKELNLIYV